MAQGNIYLLVPEGEKNNTVPLKLKEKWKFKEQPEGQPEAEPVLINPSWLKAANKLKGNFGEIRQVTYGGAQFLLIELELSFLNGEVTEVQKLQSNQAGKKAHYRILTNSEAKALLAGTDIFQ